uniref:Uncharacterized protein n=1 Tax=Oryzias sinensis TaxID=183150 RepID=A0A8C7XS13_9TELE
MAEWTSIYATKPCYLSDEPNALWRYLYPPHPSFLQKTLFNAQSISMVVFFFILHGLKCLYAFASTGSVTGNSNPMKPMPLPAPYSPYSFPPPSVQGNHPPGNHMIDYLENQVRGLDLTSPLMQSQPAPPPHMQQMPPPPQQMPINIPYSPGPPSMISALDEPPRERRIITLPPIREQPQGRGPPPAPKTRPPSSSESNRSGYSRRDERGGADRRYPSPSRSRGLPRSYSEESLDGRSRASRRSRGSFSSDEETSSRGRRGGGGWTEYEPGQKPGPRRNDPYSDKSSRSGTSIVI